MGNLNTIVKSNNFGTLGAVEQTAISFCKEMGTVTILFKNNDWESEIIPKTESLKSLFKGMVRKGKKLEKLNDDYNDDRKKFIFSSNIEENKARIIFGLCNGGENNVKKIIFNFPEKKLDIFFRKKSEKDKFIETLIDTLAPHNWGGKVQTTLWFVSRKYNVLHEKARCES